MFSIKEASIVDGYDCWGRYEYTTAYDVYCDDEFVCRMTENPGVLIRKCNEVISKVLLDRGDEIK